MSRHVRTAEIPGFVIKVVMMVNKNQKMYSRPCEILRGKVFAIQGRWPEFYKMSCGDEGRAPDTNKPTCISLLRRSVQTSSGETVNRRGGRERGNGAFNF